MSEIISDSVKRTLYKNGMFICPIPSSDSSLWSLKDWINYIDENGVWVQ